MRYFVFVLLGLLFVHSSHAANYAVDKAQSSIEFSGTHAGNPFKGRFEKWDAVIAFDPAHLAQSQIRVTVDTASAKTGNAMYDGTLPTSDWLDAKTSPQALFVSDTILRQTDGSFLAKGTLTLRGKSVPMEFNFSLSDLSASPVTTAFHTTLHRLDFGIGEKSDAKGEWVGLDIALDVKLVATAF